MDSDRTFDNCSWRMEVDDAASKYACTSSGQTKEENKPSENAPASHYNNVDMWDKIASTIPGKTVEDLRLHYPTKGSDLKEKKNLVHAQRGAPWTEEEHMKFLYGLKRFGRGNWMNISRYSVQTKSNTQVGSHARNYFKRLSSAKEGKRLSINDITTVNPECTTEASFDARNQLLLEYSNEASGDASGKKRKRPKKALACNEKSRARNLLLPVPSLFCSSFPGKTISICPMEASSDLEKLPFDGSLFSGQAMGGVGSSTAMRQVCNGSSPPFAMEPRPPPGSVEMSGRPAPSDAGVPLDAQFDIASSTTQHMDLDWSLFPHFLD